MKKIIVLAAVLSIVFCGCNSNEQTSVPNTNQPSSVPTTVAQMKADIDISSNSTVAMSGIQNITQNPDKYIGQTIKLSGIAYSEKDPADNKTYYACIVYDPSGCCTYGLEYTLENEQYPENEKNITVMGKWSKYNIYGKTYYTLKDAKLI